jgi:type I restriction enzyme S subunit
MQHSKIELNSELIHQFDLIKQLRQAFLREAMQGKLVKSTNTKETGQQLLDKIKAEKAQLITEKKLKKEKELPTIKGDEIPFEIPEHWAWCRLGEICNKVTDGTHHSPTNIQSGKYKYVTAKNIKDEGIDLSNITYVNEQVHKEIFSRCNPEKGDILYIKDGATTGIVTINNLDEEFSMLSSVALLKLPIYVYNRYLMYTMRSPFYYKATRNEMYGVAITRVTLEKIKNAIIPLPPLHEQEQIVAKLEELMAFCDGMEQSIKESQGYNEKLLQEVLREALEGEVV